MRKLEEWQVHVKNTWHSPVPKFLPRVITSAFSSPEYSMAVFQAANTQQYVAYVFTEYFFESKNARQEDASSDEQLV